jgi:hypothetical protein
MGNAEMPEGRTLVACCPLIYWVPHSALRIPHSALVCNPHAWINFEILVATPEVIANNPRSVSLGTEAWVFLYQCIFYQFVLVLILY